MEDHYNQIKVAYDDYYKSLFKVGRLPLKNTEKGFWSISCADDIFHLFNKIRLHEYQNFLDLGSGDGKVALIASLFTKSTGIEIDEELHVQAQSMKQKLDLYPTLLNADFYTHSLSSYDIIFINPDQRFTQLEPKLKKELKGRLIVYGSEFQPITLAHDMHFISHTTPVTIYLNRDQK